MIPKIIHYCWFGRNPLPTSALKCIASWRKFLPNYEIKEWNEDNFDINIIPYTRQAYEAQKYAFVSDYARFWILYHYGGLYFDTDVEVIKSFDDIVERGAFMGLEIDGTKTGTKIAIAPGLGLGAEADSTIYREILDGFETMDFYDANGKRNNFSMIPLVTNMFLERGLLANGQIQQIYGITIYPQCYFNPYNSVNGRLQLTSETHSIHWYSASWMDPKVLWCLKIKRIIRNIQSL